MNVTRRIVVGLSALAITAAGAGCGSTTAAVSAPTSAATSAPAASGYTSSDDTAYTADPVPGSPPDQADAAFVTALIGDSAANDDSVLGGSGTDSPLDLGVDACLLFENGDSVQTVMNEALATPAEVNNGTTINLTTDDVGDIVAAAVGNICPAYAPDFTSYAEAQIAS